MIKFGTDGWRAIIGDDYTVANLKRVSAATAYWLKKTHEKPVVVLGYDCRFSGELFAKVAARVLAHEGCKVHLSDNFASTPMVSLAATELHADAGVVITASHNPPMYNGFKIKSSYGGPALPAQIEEVENLIPEIYEGHIDPFEDLVDSEQIVMVDMETMYCNHARKNFDLDAIRNSGMKLAYDAMFGAGQNVLKRLLPDTICLHCEFNPSFQGTAPEPIMRNLEEISRLIRKQGDIACGLATDGDADRIGLLDSQGNFVDSHHIILMLLNYLHNKKGMTGMVVNSFSCTTKIARFCELHGLDNKVTKVGFKYICEYMVDNDVLLGGEESGGIAVKGHIPERDGIWIGLTIWEYMAKEGKKLEELISEIHGIVGPFAMERSDLHIDEHLKQEIMQKCEQDAFNSFGRYKVERIEKTDGYKFFFDEKRWLMIRPSGTEPVLRTYAEAPTHEEACEILKETKEAIC
ncbi:MAG: phosphoglucomutase/phosphomannomutase family protein [Bacteroidia bacterium]